MIKDQLKNILESREELKDYTYKGIYSMGVFPRVLLYGGIVAITIGTLINSCDNQRIKDYDYYHKIKECKKP